MQNVSQSNIIPFNITSSNTDLDPIDSNQLSPRDLKPPRRKKSPNRSISPLSPDFFVDLQKQHKPGDKSPTDLSASSSTNMPLETKESMQTLFQEATKSPRGRSHSNEVPYNRSTEPTKSPKELALSSRPRSNDIHNFERPVTSPKKPSSSSESEDAETLTSEKSKKIISSPDHKLPLILLNKNEGSSSQPILKTSQKIELESPKSPRNNKQLKNSDKSIRTDKQQQKLTDSQNRRKETQLLKHQSQGQTIEQQSTLFKKEIEKNLTPLLNEVKRLTAVLKEIGLPKKSPKANRLASFELGQAILQPINGDVMKSFVLEYINYGIHNPKVCAQEMWRSMESTKIYDYKSDKPLIDGTTINQEGDEKIRDKEISIHMGKTLNLFFRHVTQSKDELIPEKDFGNSQTDASNIGMTLVQRIKEKDGNDSSILMTMQLMLGLGKQELLTQPATWTIPKEFQTVGGNENLIVTEYGPTFAEILTPLKCNREISIKMKEDGGIDYIVEQPITFKNRETFELLGACRMQTTFSFNKDMDFISQIQKIKAAPILE